MRFQTKERNLTTKEQTEATGVFGNTLPRWEFIKITNGLGINDRAFTVRGIKFTKVGTIAKIGGIVGGIGSVGSALANLFIYMHVGPQMYADALTDSGTFIHEMTHVWQYHHGSPVIFDSLKNQALLGDKAYDYVAGKSWGTYNVEQQAHIVEDWYKYPSLKPDLDSYITDYVRKGKTG